MADDVFELDEPLGGSDDLALESQALSSSMFSAPDVSIPDLELPTLDEISSELTVNLPAEEPVPELNHIAEGVKNFASSEDLDMNKDEIVNALNEHRDELPSSVVDPSGNLKVTPTDNENAFTYISRFVNTLLGPNTSTDKSTVLGMDRSQLSGLALIYGLIENERDRKQARRGEKKVIAENEKDREFRSREAEKDREFRERMARLTLELDLERKGPAVSAPRVGKFGKESV